MKKYSIYIIAMLIMLPQISETMYSTALLAIAQDFNLSPSQTTQTFSIYFLFFALGILVWGYLCDVIGRKLTIILGLSLYSLSCFYLLYTYKFSDLIILRGLCAFGISVCSITTQTLIRDNFKGNQLNSIFALIGIGLAISPSIGMILGYFIVNYAHYKIIFISLSLFAFVFILISHLYLIETYDKSVSKASLKIIVWQLWKDQNIWQCAWLIALLNVMLISFYRLIPFYFDHLKLSTHYLIYSSVCIGFGLLVGAYLNQYLIKKNTTYLNLLFYAFISCSVGTMLMISCVYLQKCFFFIFIFFIAIGYSVAIPNLLSHALSNYQKQIGTAGALFGLLYYFLISLTVFLTSYLQSLGIILITGCVLSFLCLIKIRYF